MVNALAGKPKSRKGGDSSNDHDGKGEVWGKEDLDTDDKDGAEEKPKVKADFGLSGVLATDEVTGNVFNGLIS